MQRSESVGALAAALAKAQGQMGAAVKTKENPHFRSRYADLADVIEAVKKPLSDNGIAFAQWVVSGERGVGVQTMLVHSSGEWMMGDACLVPMEKASAHGFGSALTYARRYSLSAAVGLKTDEDDDGNTASGKQSQGVIPQEVVDRGRERLRACKTLDELRDEMRKLLTLAQNSADDKAREVWVTVGEERVKALRQDAGP